MNKISMIYKANQNIEEIKAPEVQAVSFSTDILELLEGTRREAMEELDSIQWDLQKATAQIERHLKSKILAHLVKNWKITEKLYSRFLETFEKTGDINKKVECTWEEFAVFKITTPIWMINLSNTAAKKIWSTNFLILAALKWDEDLFELIIKYPRVNLDIKDSYWNTPESAIKSYFESHRKATFNMNSWDSKELRMLKMLEEAKAWNPEKTTKKSKPKIRKK